MRRHGLIVCSLHNLETELTTKNRASVYGSIGGVGLDAKPIIHGVSESLLTSQVFFRRLHRYMAEQKLDLLQLAP